MFEIKTFDSIVRSTVENIALMSDEITDFNVGSKARTLVEAFAREQDQIYQNLLKGLMEAVPTAIYKGFGFTKLPATPAAGLVRFTRVSTVTGNISIPAGTRVKVPSTLNTYSTQEAQTLLSENSYVDIYVSASATGTDGNAAAGTITELVDEVSGIATVSNPSAFSTGTDEETDQARRIRFAKWVATLSRSTRAAVKYGAETAKLTASGLITERVVKSLVWEPCIDATPLGDPGYIEVYIWNGVDGASSDLIAEAKRIIEGYEEEDGTKVAGWKAAGIICDVLETTAQAVNITATITPSGGYTVSGVTPGINTVLDAYFAGLEIGEPCIRSKLIDLIMGVEGVYDVSLSTPAANIDPAYSAICTKGTITLS